MSKKTSTQKRTPGSLHPAGYTAMFKPPQRPYGETFTCPWCGLRKHATRYNGLNDGKTGKPVCGDCEEAV